MVLRNKAFGTAHEFVWAQDSSEYAIREGTTTVKVFKNFKEKKSFKPEFGAEGIFGGFLLGVRSVSGLALYDWDTLELVRRIEIQPRHVYWSESGELVALATDDSYFVLRYDAGAVQAAREQGGDAVTQDGIEEAFDVLGEVHESVRTGLWVGDCFIYTNSVNRINYYVGGEIVTVSHLDRTMYLLGYVAKDNRLYLGDKELNIVSYSLLLSVLEYQTAVMRGDFETADKVLPTVPTQYRTRVAHFLEKQGFKQQALAVSTDPEHRFELALQLGELEVATTLAREAGHTQKWRQLAELATTKGELGLAQECLHQAQDFGGLLLLATSAGNADMVRKLGDSAESTGKNNIAFLSFLLLGELDKCLQILIDTDRLPEAAFFARTYLPSQISRVVGLWRESLSKVSEKAGQSLADPKDYENLFPGLTEAFKTEQYLEPERRSQLPASAYINIPANHERNAVEEMKTAEVSGRFHYRPPGVAPEDHLLTGDEEHSTHTIPQADNLAAYSYVLPPTQLPAAATAQSASAPPPVTSQEDDDLDLDLDNMNLDDIDTSFDSWYEPPMPELEPEVKAPPTTVPDVTEQTDLKPLPEPVPGQDEIDLDLDSMNFDELDATVSTSIG
ncbi:Coatomer subunit beta', variant 2 [Homalodisca vitripennis]|nr:Coatomer subunit beta', variant 2 [Homalodisca vitripennis]